MGVLMKNISFNKFKISWCRLVGCMPNKWPLTPKIDRVTLPFLKVDSDMGPKKIVTLNMQFLEFDRQNSK